MSFTAYGRRCDIHSDTSSRRREAPYIAKDMGKHIYSTVSGQGSSRGAYEQV